MRVKFVVLSALIGCLALLLGLGEGRTQNPGAPPAGRERTARAQRPSPQAPKPVAGALTDWVAERFQRLDRNGDGFLTLDEMTENLQAEKHKWDANRDGRIDLGEWRAYVAAFNASRRRPATNPRTVPRRSVRRPGPQFGQRPTWNPRNQGVGRRPSVQRAVRRPPFDEGRLSRRMGHRNRGTSSAKYPANLPAWFSEYDADGDGQVSLREWKEREDDVWEFWKYDLNKDGFITVEELIVSGQYVTDKGEVPPLRMNIFRAEPGVFFYVKLTGASGDGIQGTGVYTFNSSLATAAVHAGVLRVGETRLVKVTILPGQTEYLGTTRNGVTSRDFGAFPKSYRVEKAP